MADLINPTQPIAPSPSVTSKADREKKKKSFVQKQKHKKSSNDKTNREGIFDEYV